MTMLKNKTAAIFAASGAIASAVAKSFAAHGAQVYLSARNFEDVQKLAAEIKQAGGNAKAFRVDAMSEEAIDSFLQTVVKETGKLDIVFNGIGVRAGEAGYGTPTTSLDLNNFMLPIQVHLGSQFLTSRVAARYMMQTKSSGTILTLTASLSRIKVPFMAGITAACAGIEGLTRVLASEFGRAGIKVICINPTAMAETRTIQETSAANAATMGITIEQFAKMQGPSLLGNHLTLKDMAEAASFLASDAGAVFNSHIVDLDFGTMSVI
jgi:NAD(P)-dependent dehydrogenase (short-subunit alcohol dehydrogenase family)